MTTYGTCSWHHPEIAGGTYEYNMIGLNAVPYMALSTFSRVTVTAGSWGSPQWRLKAFVNNKLLKGYFFRLF